MNGFTERGLSPFILCVDVCAGSEQGLDDLDMDSFGSFAKRSLAVFASFVNCTRVLSRQ